MAAALSDEEFQRMQIQLLDLRTKNYTLGEKNVKIQSELLQSNKSVDDLRKELAKCQKVLNRSKNAKDVDHLIQENDSLQQKLQMQEDEFRLQNETLMKEISDLVAYNSELKKSAELSKTYPLASTELQGQDDKIKLEAENAALRKLIANYEGDANSDLRQADQVELSLKLKTLEEEKRLVLENTRQVEAEYKELLLKIQTENEKLVEKLKKKQESILILQEEKEKLYNENKKMVESCQTLKDTEVKQLKEELKDMLIELNEALQVNEQHTDLNREKDIEATVELNGNTASFDCSLNETKVSFTNVINKIQLLNKQLSDSESELKHLKSANEDLNLNILRLENDFSKSQESLAEKNALAEKRKKMMDDMKEHLKEATDKQFVEIENLTRKLSEEQEAFESLYDKEKQTQIRLIETKNELQALKDEVERLRKAHCGAEDHAKELEEKLKTNLVEFEKSRVEIHDRHAEELEKLKENFQLEIKDLTIQLEVSKAEKTEFEEKINRLQQEAKDSIDDRKIQEKKGLAMVKDLKRQLQVERNRAEKLQERLQEALNEQNKSVDEILQSSGGFDKQKGDASSISSWSYVSGGTAERESKDVTLQSDSSSGGHESPNRLSPTVLESETTSLLSKVAQLQQKNWILEEKVNHLEMSNEALVDDVLKKTALIQFYCMEGRTDPHASSSPDKLTIKKIVDFIKDRGDENLKEMNRKMQRMLEETLTKNMHLQKDVETLSNEVSRLSKLAVSPIENGIQSDVSVD